MNNRCSLWGMLLSSMIRLRLNVTIDTKPATHQRDSIAIRYDVTTGRIPSSQN